MNLVPLSVPIAVLDVSTKWNEGEIKQNQQRAKQRKTSASAACKETNANCMISFVNKKLMSRRSSRSWRNRRRAGVTEWQLANWSRNEIDGPQRLTCAGRGQLGTTYCRCKISCLLPATEISLIVRRNWPADVAAAAGCPATPKSECKEPKKKKKNCPKRTPTSRGGD